MSFQALRDIAFTPFDSHYSNYAHSLRSKVIIARNMAGPRLSLLLSWIIIGMCLVSSNNARHLKRTLQTSSGSGADFSAYKVPVSNGTFMFMCLITSPRMNSSHPMYTYRHGCLLEKHGYRVVPVASNQLFIYFTYPYSLVVVLTHSRCLLTPVTRLPHSQRNYTWPWYPGQYPLTKLPEPS